MSKQVPKETKRANEKADDAGRVYECVTCGDWTGYPFDHAQVAHGKRSLRLEDFRLIRGALHRPSGPRGGTVPPGPMLPFG